MPIELKGLNYYSKVFKRIYYRLSNSIFWVVITLVVIIGFLFIALSYEIKSQKFYGKTYKRDNVMWWDNISYVKLHKLLYYLIKYIFKGFRDI